VRLIVVDVVDEDAADRVRQEVPAQQRAGVDDVAPRLADALGNGEAPWRQDAEDAGEGVIRQSCNGLRRLHMDDCVADCGVVPIRVLARWAAARVYILCMCNR
jgi:hypothetical protein